MATMSKASGNDYDDLQLTELDDDSTEGMQQQPEQSDSSEDSSASAHRRTHKSEHETTRFVENQKELVALQRLDDKCTLLQQEGKYTEALECMEKGLVLRQHFFGADSDEVRQACKTVGEMCNLLAMTYLQQEQFTVVLELLKKAEILTEQHAAGRAVTLNNFACYYRRQGNLHKALTYLTEAIKIETKLENVSNKADTHLNMCAVLSQLGKHQSALGHAQSALILLHEELELGSSKSDRSHGSPSKHRSNNSSHSASGSIDANKLDRVAVLGIAYHNVGVEHEFLKCYDQSLQSYKKGVDVTARYLGDAHGIVVTLQNSLLTAKRHIAATGRTDGRSGDGISGLAHAKRPNKFAQLASSLKSSIGKTATKKKSAPSGAATTTTASPSSSNQGSSSNNKSVLRSNQRSQHNRVAPEG